MGSVPIIVAPSHGGGSEMNGTNRREFMQAASIAGMFSGVSGAAVAQGVSGAGTVDPANTSRAEIIRTHKVGFSAIGFDQGHIYGRRRAIQGAGAGLVS